MAETARRELGPAVTLHERATIVTIEGPRFSSKAESLLFKSWNCDVINMTTVPEVALAAEAGIAYCSVAMVTDYDCWKDTGESVSVEAVMAVLKANIDNVKKLFVKVIGNLVNNQAQWSDVVAKNKAKAKCSVMG